MRELSVPVHAALVNLFGEIPMTENRQLSAQPHVRRMRDTKEIEAAYEELRDKFDPVFRGRLSMSRRAAILKGLFDMFKVMADLAGAPSTRRVQRHPEREGNGSPAA